MTRIVIVVIALLAVAGIAGSMVGTDDAGPRRAPPKVGGGGAGKGGGQVGGLDPRVDGTPRQRGTPAGSDRRGRGGRDRDGGGWQNPEGERSPGWGEQPRRPRAGGGDGGGQALRPASPSDPSINIKIPVRTRSSSGTAFSVDQRGLWMTARHVVDSCPKLYVLTGPRRGFKVNRVYVHPRADLALMVTKRGTEAFKFSWDRLRRGMAGYHFGFPKGKPGDVTSRLIGRRTMRVHGRYRTAEPVVAWAERNRVPNFPGGLGGISGGPVFDQRGRIIGVTVAGTVRRGRVYTTALVSMRAALQRARVTLPGSSREVDGIDQQSFPEVASNLRRRLRIAKVVCLVPRSRSRSRRRPLY